MGGITEPEMRLERQVGAAVVESLCHTLRSLHACSLVCDGELARLMNRKWHGQSWALGSSLLQNCERCVGEVRDCRVSREECASD